jgi:hypothetical protein
LWQFATADVGSILCISVRRFVHPPREAHAAGSASDITMYFVASRARWFLSTLAFAHCS